MVSGIPWIPDLKMFMLTFKFKAVFVKQSSTMNPMKKLEIVINIMFFLFGVSYHIMTFYYIPLV